MFVKARLLDGGFASTMQLLGKEVDGDPLWTSRCLQTDPEAIVKVHSAFLHAGAEILITASYQASIDGFCTHLKISREQSIQLIKDSVTLAKVAVSNFDRPDRDILVAGSIGPYGACLADGSEYSGSYVQHLTEQELMDWHQPRLEALLDAGVDLLALETIPALAEALALLKLLKKYPSAKAWVSFSCKVIILLRGILHVNETRKAKLYK
ncbi:UNVERIFIED_CONTAM: hypothetical protein GTU68_000814 [Idotea baltica]|nr:hypothetical protein [Idotea baltica]